MIKKGRKNLSKTKEEAWEKKMEWLSEAVPQIGDERGGFVHQIRGNDEAYTLNDDTVTLQSACRTSDYMKHMDIINAPFTQNIKDTLEKIKDVPDTDDFYLLQEFKAKRKKEKAILRAQELAEE